MIEKYRDGHLPPASVLVRAKEIDLALASQAERTLADMNSRMDDFALEEALRILWALIGAGNKYIDETSPWKLGRDDPDDRLDIVLRTLWEVLNLSAMLAYPFMPDTSGRIRRQLGLPENMDGDLFTSWSWGGNGHDVTVKKGDVLFPRIDVTKWKEEKAAREAAKAAPEIRAASASPGEERFEQIEMSDFKKLEIRVALIERADVVENASKLYKLSLDLGFEKRVIVSSIREFFTQEELVGKKILVLCNLKPAKFRGIESNGMLLAAEADDRGREIISLAEVDGGFPVGSLIH
jgi:methionyl-tRNA synthetase